MAKKKQHMAPRVVLSGIIAGCLLFGAGVVAVEQVLPSQDRVGTGRVYGYVYSGAKSESVAFNTKADAADSMLLFGSSELSTSTRTVSTAPRAVLGTYDYGVDLTFVGEAYDQSLWQAIAAGAYSTATTNKKVAIIVSPTWFEDGGMDNETFGLRFSYSLYRAFCDNPNISEGSRSYVAKRLAQQGIDDMEIQAGLRQMPQDYVNDAVLAGMDDLRIRNDLVKVRELGFEQRSKQSTAPSFKKLRVKARKDAKAACTNNKWGFDDEFYSSNIEGNLERLKGSHSQETYSDTPEYSDFTFFLKVCRETGLEPLVIISPVYGKFFDWEGISKKVRSDCYERIRTICKKTGVEYADFSDKEYENYFLHDIVHFGWTGWVDVQKAIVRFANDQ